MLTIFKATVQKSHQNILSYTAQEQQPRLYLCMVAIAGSCTIYLVRSYSNYIIIIIIIIYRIEGKICL